MAQFTPEMRVSVLRGARMKSVAYGGKTHNGNTQFAPGAARG